MRIALVGHACSPVHGSEPGVTWNWAAKLSEHHDVTLITHPLCREHVDAELAARPRPGLRLEWVTLDKRWDPWKPQRNDRGIKLHYGLWQRKALDRARELHGVGPFDLVHHVSWATLQQPPPLWKMRLPFIWGPIGGGQTWPKRFMEFATTGRAMERIRRIIVKMSRWNPAIIRAARRADLVLTTNRETSELLNRVGARRVEYFADYGVQEQWFSTAERPADAAGELKMFWAGRCEPRKGLPLVLEAMAKVPDAKIRLTCAGDGPLRQAWTDRARELGLGDRVEFLGMVPWTRMSELFLSHDVFLFPSLRDSQGTVILEAMARGLPLIALDHQGVAKVLPHDAGIKVPVSDPATTIDGLAKAMRKLADEPELRRSMGRAASACAAEQTWEKKVVQMNRWYEEVVRAHRGV